MENLALIDSFSEFKDDKLIDRVTLMSILEEVFRNTLKRKYGDDDNFDIIINATSLGLKKEDDMNLDFSSVGKNKFFYDVIYNPKETNFLKIGKELGNKTLNGKLMFIYQAFSAFNIWHGIEPDIDENVIKLLD